MVALWLRDPRVTRVRVLRTPPTSIFTASILKNSLIVLD